MIDRDTAFNVLSGLPPTEYVVEHIIVETPEEEKARKADPFAEKPKVGKDSSEDQPIIATHIENLVSASQAIDGQTLNPVEIEKDDDSNFHIDWIHACSNLRARNYRIDECDRNRTKMIAGRIIPAIATTTAMITGIVSNEIYKFTQGFTELEKFKNANVNLALPSVMFFQPDPVIKN